METIDESEKTVARCDWRKIINASDDVEAETITAMDKYFATFAEPGTDCPGCGRKVFGVGAVGAFLATFQWGIAHGHGICGECGWPAVVHHFVKDGKGEEVLNLQNFGLVVHPDYVRKNSQ